ncbi:unnamed protein product [Danaus chrysippus]|uniref:Mannosyltransferase n=1 Tax=Danaus chrysippus TaxID=151541 RepID=A0A8J2R507_9NEOP|nr:unnamed protein product [Danaus chrysippus]
MGLMMFSVVVPVAALSLFPHQEARFIIPILLPLVYLYGNYLYPNESDGPRTMKLKTSLRYVWYTTNIILTIFFGFIHQAGIYPLANSLHHEIKSTYGHHMHVITTHSYSIPTFLLQLESTTRVYKDRSTGRRYRLAPTTFLHKYGSMPINELFTKIDKTLSNAEELLHKQKRQYRFYVASPCSLEQKIREENSRYPYIDIEEDFSIYPHFSSEALPEFPSRRDQYCSGQNLKLLKESQRIDLTLYQRISCYLKRFCLRVYRVTPSKKTHF